MEATFRAGEFKIDSGLCNCCIQMTLLTLLSWRFLLSLAFLAEQSSSRLVFCQIPPGQCWGSIEVNPYFLHSPEYCPRSQSIADRNFSINFLSFLLSFKIAKDKMLVRLIDFASLQMFVEWRQNVKFDCQNILIGRQNMFLSPVWTGSCKRLYFQGKSENIEVA